MKAAIELSGEENKFKERIFETIRENTQYRAKEFKYCDNKNTYTFNVTCKQCGARESWLDYCENGKNPSIPNKNKMFPVATFDAINLIDLMKQRLNPHVCHTESEKLLYVVDLPKIQASRAPSRTDKNKLFGAMFQKVDELTNDPAFFNLKVH